LSDWSIISTLLIREANQKYRFLLASFSNKD
jgi:hypothetical protein